MVSSFKAWLGANLGKQIFIPGYKTAECVAPFWKFNAEHKKESYIAPGAANLWTTTGGAAYIWDSYTRISTGFVYGDWVIWAGGWGAYRNGGAGHVAMFIRHTRPGYAMFASQNPGAFREMELSLSGVLGALRAHGVPAGTTAKPAGTALVNRKMTQPGMVRTAPNHNAPLAPGYPAALPAGTILAVRGYVVGTRPYPGQGNAWLRTKSGYYVWIGAIGSSLAGLVKL